MMTSKTLLHVINSLGVGGAEVLLANTISLLPSCKHVVVTLAPGGDLLETLQPKLEAYYCLDALAVRAWPKGISGLRSIIRKHQPALVHTHLQFAGIVGRLACTRKTPLFYTLHSPYGVDAFATNRFALMMERLVARPYHHLIGVSKLVLDEYRSFVPRSGSGDVVYNTVSKDFFDQGLLRSKSDYSAGLPLKCVSVGSLKRAKNYLFSLMAFLQLRDLPVTLDIYGAGGDEASLKLFIESASLHNVRLMGKTDQIHNLLPQYDLYLISSSYEGFGIAPLEAMAAGLPVLVSDIPVFREVIGSAALYFDLNNENSLANTLRNIMDGTVSLKGLSAAGREQAIRVAHPKHYIESLLGVYEKYL
ncbi:MAG: glycosyltransferase family 4 protein [Bacteroidetes bacterium]|nr:glycosyltransferase family 4 protein [Bacteroidota bacterium]